MERKDKLLQRIQQALTRYDQQKPKISKDEASAILKEVRDQLQKIPRLSKKQFLELPKDQRENYITLIEQLAAKSSIALRELDSVDYSQLGHTALTGRTIGVDHPKIPTTHYTLEAIKIAQKLEQERHKKKLEEQRKKLIDKNLISVPRLLFKLKCDLIGVNEKQQVHDFVAQSVLLRQQHIDALNNQSQLAKGAVVLADLKAWNVPLYAQQECFLYAFGDFKMNRVIVDAKAQAKRDLLNQKLKEYNEYNEMTRKKWPSLSKLERLRYFVKPEYIKDFEEIVEKGKKIGLTEEKIVELAISTVGKESSMFVGDFTGELSKPHEKIVDADLSQGVHTISLKLAEYFKVPESVLLESFSERELVEAYNEIEKKK